MDYHKTIISQVSSKRRPAVALLLWVCIRFSHQNLREAVEEPSHIFIPGWCGRLRQLSRERVSNPSYFTFCSAPLHLTGSLPAFCPRQEFNYDPTGLSTNTAPIHMDHYSIQGDKRRMQNQTTITVWHSLLLKSNSRKKSAPCHKSLKYHVRCFLQYLSHLQIVVVHPW